MGTGPGHPNMNHWAAMYWGWLDDLVDDFGEPSWAITSPYRPWAVEAVPSHEETEALFQDDLRRFATGDVSEVTFSRDLVPAGYRTLAPEAVSQPHNAAEIRYGLYSRRGEPLEFTVTTGQIVAFRNRPPAFYSVLDASSNVVTEGRLPLDGLPHVLNVPGACPRPVLAGPL